ncbi:MAG TPA: discoidin domain-containing protein [Clostridiaceae bacterium]|nr:discoidin domain-containing protein [Clostridiaceae bacterium]
MSRRGRKAIALILMLAITISMSGIPLIASAEGTELNIEGIKTTSSVLPGTNVALASNGGKATASSEYSRDFPASSVIDGDRKGVYWGQGGGWADATPDVYSDWVQIDFNDTYTIDTINVFTLQDNVTIVNRDIIEPTLTLDFSLNGITDFNVQYWDGSSWKDVPGGHVTDNINVWRQLRFAAVTTDKIRVVVNASLNKYSRIVEIEALTESEMEEPEPGTNVALVSNKAIATASSQYSDNYPAEAVINGERKGINYNNGGVWMDGTPGTYPDWVQIEFNSTYSINAINVYTVQDNLNNPQEPYLELGFTQNGITEFEVQYWNGSSWVTIPGGSVSGNDKVWRRFKFEPVTTNKIRVLITGAKGGYCRLTEIEAITPVPDNMLSHTSKLFIQRGMQFQTSITTDLSGREFPTAEEWLNSGFNSAAYYEEPFYNATLSAAVPGLQWNICRYYGTTGDEDALSDLQRADVENLVSISFCDEVAYSKSHEQACRDFYKKVRARYPNVMLHNNQIGGGQWSMSEMRTYIRNAKPDFITFDHYYFSENGSDINITTNICNCTAMYRKLSLEGWDGTGEQPIGFGQYLIGFKTGPNPWATGWYEATESQLYVVPFITMTLGGKWMSMFRWEFYNENYHDGTKFLLFDPDRNPTRHYYWYSEIGKQVKNLGTHLIRLYSSDVQFIPGQHKEGSSVVSNAFPNYMSHFASKEDYNLVNVTAVNLGTENGGLPGDVIIGYFDILPGVDRSFFTCTNPKYFMVTNGLNTGNGKRPEEQHGSCEETKQKITLTFDFSTGGDPTRLKKVNRNTGEVESVSLTKISDSIYKLDLILGGGQGELLFFEHDGDAPEPYLPPDPQPITPSEPTPVDPPIVAELPTNVALAKPYTKSIAPHPAYPDANNKKSTDGILQTGDSYSNLYGYYIDEGSSITVDLVVDLGSVKEINEVRTEWCKLQRNYGADRVTVYTGTDNVNYEQKGTSLIPPGGDWYDIQFEPTNARYVKLRFEKTRYEYKDWLFIGEVQVFSPTEDQTPETVLLSRGKPYSKSQEPHSAYPDTNNAESTDGQLGAHYSDGKAYGYHIGQGSIDVDITLDLEGIHNISKVKVWEYPDSANYRPDSIIIYTSTDNVNFVSQGTVSTAIEGWYTVGFEPIDARYVKVKFVKNGADYKDWLFIDEIEVYGEEGTTEPNPPDTMLLSSGKSYIKSAEPHSAYPDTNNTESTDGQLGVHYSDGKSYGYYVGQESIEVDITLDLESVYSISKVKVWEYPDRAGYRPDSITVYTSTDNVNFVSQGTVSSAVEGWYIVGFEPVNARYVKVKFEKSGSYYSDWLFIDEIEVYGTSA